MPAVTISPKQTVIQPGKSVMLYWNATDALSCSIDNGIGQVEVNDSITVSPEITTTYTIAATGPAGTATATSKVIVKPTVYISATKSIIRAGTSTTLTWISKNADTCTITPDVGNVVLNGSTIVTPAATTTYTITATGEGGTATATVTVTTVSLDISIESPLDGATINRPDVMVKGTVTNVPDCETGVTVNGVGALVYFNGTNYEFAANHVPLEEGENEITVSVKDVDGTYKTATITIDAELGDGDKFITVTPYEEIGVSPFETTLRLDGTFRFTEDPNVSASSNNVNIVKNSGEYTYATTISSIGLYYVTAEAVYNNTTYSDTVALLVNDQATLDAILKSIYNGMKTALANGDINTALSYIAEESRDLYAYNFNLLHDQLSEISSKLNDIQLDNVTDGKADYSMDIEFEGDSYNMLVRFVKDNDGIWRIKFF
jgi:hypothetical protein